VPAPRNLVLDGATRLSQGPHPERAHQDAEVLMLELLGKNKAWLLAHADEMLPDTETARYAESIDRRFRGEPIQYITGEAEFYGLPFRVTPEVLIPRPETEHLVEKVLELAANYAEPRIVDVGTGSGAIAVALAHHLPHAAITAIDLSAPALDLARRNAERNGVASRIHFCVGDLLAPVAEEQFEFVVSNPPYVPCADRATLAVEVRDYEPALALFAGDDGLEVYRWLLPAAFAALIPGGYIALEIGYGQEAALRSLLEGSGFEGIEFVPDLKGIARVACASTSPCTSKEDTGPS
jgi:release factor glutamine methyltransferase